MSTVARRAKTVTFYVVAGIAALLTGLLTVGSTVELTSASDPDLRLALIAHLPWLGLCWCAAFAAMLRHPARRPAAYQQALATVVGLYVGGLLLARENDPIFYIGFGVVLILLYLLHPARRSLLRPGRQGISPLLVPVALVGAAPLTLYATRMLDLHTDGVADDGFYLGIAATALAVPCVGLVAGLRADGYRLPLWTAGLTLAVLCLGSLTQSSGVASMPTPWALAGVVGGAAFVALGEWERRHAAEIGASAASSGTPRHDTPSVSR